MTDYNTILSHSFFTDLVLPFLLVFTLIFAILEKTGVLGEDKQQINAIIGFVVGLGILAFPSARDLIVQLMPVLAVIAVVILIFMMLYGFVGGDLGDESWIKYTFGGLIGAALIISLLVFTNLWDFILGGLGTEQGMTIASNIFFVVVIIAAIIVVIKGGGEE